MSRLTADLVQPENSHGALSTAPILILLPAPNAPIEAAWTAPPVDGDTHAFSVSICLPANIAARRAGYSQIFLSREIVLYRRASLPFLIGAISLPSLYCRRLGRSLLRPQRSSPRPIGSNGWPR